MTHPLTPREKVLFKQPCDHCHRTTTIDHRMVITALASGSGDHAPVAWRVRLLDGGWVVCGYEQTALELAAARKGATVQALYEPALLAEIAALRGANTEAERKLAEAVGVVEWYGENARLARLIHSEGDAGRNALADDGGKRARTFLSKEAERG